MGVGAGTGVGIAVGVGSGMEVIVSSAGADGFESVKKGIKLTLPKEVEFLLSKIVWLITEASVVPHQLFLTSAAFGVDIPRLY